jgi:DNA-binding XRE family transcriptional regulator
VLHNRITVLRTARGVSRKALAEAVGVNHQTIGFLERGDYAPSLELGMRLARYFDLPVELVFSFEPFEPLEQQLKRTIGPPAPHAAAAAAGD